MTPELIQALSSIGLSGGLIVAVWAFSTDRIVTGARHKSCETTNKELRTELKTVAAEAVVAIRAQAETNKHVSDAQSQIITRLLKLLGDPPP